MKKLLSVVATAAVVTWSGAVSAADWNFYGSARVSTFWSDSDLNGNNLDMSLQNNSRIGANVKVSDELDGRFEYGIKDGNVSLRLLYGEWNFGGGTLTVGQDYTPLYMPVSNQTYDGDAGLQGWGEAYGGRHAQIKLQFGGFQVAAVEPDNTYLNAGGTTAISTDTENKIPRLEAKYVHDFNNLTLGVGAGYNKFDIDTTTASDDVTSYIGVIEAKFNTGGVYLGAQGFAGQNVGNLIKSDTTGTDAGKGYAQFDGTRTIDNDAVGYELVAGYVFNDLISVEAGFGYMQTELDNVASTKDKVQSYYLQAPINLAPGVQVIPEVGRLDYREGTQDDITYIGAKWQINF